MFGSETLDVAIGLIFIFLLLSLITTSIREAIETVLKHRARDLNRGIREMFGDPDGTGFASQFYNHPLINGLFMGDYDSRRPRNLPSYISPRIFALTVMDLLKPATAKTAAGAAFSTASAGAIANPHLRIDAFEELRAAASDAQNETVRRALLPLIDAAGGDAVRARENIEDWYNSAMDRVSGWYKRRTQQIIAAIGFGLALLLNADALSLARYLDTNQTARAVVISRLQASTHISGPPTSDLVDPLGWVERQGGLPLGWLFAPAEHQSHEDFAHDWRRLPETFGAWCLKLSGILFTTLAVSLGAPFWFDLLNKFMIVRSTVKPQEKSPAEPSKA